MKLSDDGVGYSPSERRVFGILSGSGTVTAEEISRRMYARGKAPYHAVRVAMSTTKALGEKIRMNREPFVLKKSARKGPYPIHFWLEAK